MPESRGIDVHIKSRNNSGGTLAIEPQILNPDGIHWNRCGSDSSPSRAAEVYPNYTRSGLYQPSSATKVRVLWAVAGTSVGSPDWPDPTPSNGYHYMYREDTGGWEYDVNASGDTPVFEFQTSVYINLSQLDNSATEDPLHPTAPVDQGSIKVYRTGSVSSDQIVAISVTGTATRGNLPSDYILKETFYPTDPVVTGSTTTIHSNENFVEIRVIPWYDGSSEYTETCIFTIQSSSQYSVGTDYTVTVNIYNTD